MNTLNFVNSKTRVRWFKSFFSFIRSSSSSSHKLFVQSNIKVFPSSCIPQAKFNNVLCGTTIFYKSNDVLYENYRQYWQYSKNSTVFSTNLTPQKPKTKMLKRKSDKYCNYLYNFIPFSLLIQNMKCVVTHTNIKDLENKTLNKIFSLPLFLYDSKSKNK